jgi:hypothetical protein
LKRLLFQFFENVLLKRKLVYFGLSIDYLSLKAICLFKHLSSNRFKTTTILSFKFPLKFHFNAKEMSRLIEFFRNKTIRFFSVSMLVKDNYIFASALFHSFRTIWRPFFDFDSNGFGHFNNNYANSDFLD